MKSLVGGPLLAGGLGPGPPGSPLNAALILVQDVGRRVCVCVCVCVCVGGCRRRCAASDAVPDGRSEPAVGTRHAAGLHPLSPQPQPCPRHLQSVLSLIACWSRSVVVRTDDLQRTSREFDCRPVQGRRSHRRGYIVSRRDTLLIQ